MQPGQLLCDRYRIEKALAAGGFGQTFLAVDTHLPSRPQVVVKLLKPAQTDPATLQIAQRLFNTEAETLERLGKDNDRIPSLYAYFPLQGEFYLVQEYIAGTTLTDELQKRKISESDTLTILQEILTGLTKVHRQNIIHRDLKPDNIIRRKIDRKLVLIDFGAVKQIRAANAGTPNTIISQTIGIGSPGYMPTEQGMGSPKLASDVYAVGAIAIQCLTGSHPYYLFDNDTLQLEWQHLCRVNRDLATVIDRMVAPDYRQRYANANEALNAIESLISPPQQQVKPPAQTQPKTPSQTNRQKFQFQTAKLEIITKKEIVTKKGLLWINKQVEVEKTETKITYITGEAEYFSEVLGKGVNLDMVYIPAGSFDMGSDEYSFEKPVHRIKLSSFCMGQYPITQQQYQAIVCTNPSYCTGDNRPVEGVSWSDAMAFCQKLSERTGKEYSLPSESQWEYACRAGTTTPFYYGETISTDLANYSSNYEYPKRTTDVDTFPANAWGLYDMHGNVSEWCLDEWVNNYKGAPTDGSARVNISLQSKEKRLTRGGSLIDVLYFCRSASRFCRKPDNRYFNVGFRVVCEIPRTL